MNRTNSGPEEVIARLREWAEAKLALPLWTEPYDEYGDRGYLVGNHHERDCGLQVLAILNGETE